MRIAVDTNVLVRIVTEDDAHQYAAAMSSMEEADLVAISIHALCELAWVLRQRYRMKREEIADAIRSLIKADNVVVNRPLAQAGLLAMSKGGDFADGVIAHDGRVLGGNVFVSFDRKATEIVREGGQPSILLGPPLPRQT